MCEILLLVFLCQSLGKSIRAKHHDPIMYQILLVFCWFGGEIAGAVLGVVMGGGIQPGRDNPNAALLGLLFAVIGAGCGAGFVFMLAGNLRSRYVPGRSASSQKIMFPPTSSSPLLDSPWQAVSLNPLISPPGMVRFYCPQGHLLEESASAAGQHRQCPYCRYPCIVPIPTGRVQ